jgi:hypothetical protein
MAGKEHYHDESDSDRRSGRSSNDSEREESDEELTQEQKVQQENGLRPQKWTTRRRTKATAACSGLAREGARELSHHPCTRGGSRC